MDILIKALIAIVYGTVIGVITIPLSKKLASTRTEDPGELAPLGRISVKLLLIFAGVAFSAGLVFTAADDFPLLARNMLLLIPILSICAVDALVRKIPNPLLLSMLVIELVYVLYYCISNKTTDIIPKIFVGFLLGMVVGILPGFLKIPMGAGDKKYMAVIGICIYATGYFQSMILMSLFVLIFYIGLKITKKGNIKTQIPMGPFLSVGTVITMCFSVFDVLGVTDLI